MLCEITYDKKDDDIIVIGEDWNTTTTVEIRELLEVFIGEVNKCFILNKLPYAITKI